MYWWKRRQQARAAKRYARASGGMQDARSPRQIAEQPRHERPMMGLPSHRQRWRAIIAACTLVGVLVGIGSAIDQGSHYSSTVTMRGAAYDPGCIYYSCPNAKATAVGYKFSTDQTAEIQSRDMAQRVANNTQGAPSATQLMHNVRARTVGNSFTISLTYTDSDKERARRMAWAYSQQYLKWANDTAAGGMGDLLAISEKAYQGLSRHDKLRTQRGRELGQTIDKLAAAKGAYAEGHGPGSPIVFASSPDSLPSTRITPAVWQAGIMGGAAGLVVGFGIFLLRGGRRETLTGEPLAFEAA